MAVSSDVPLVRKLGIRPGSRLRFVRLPAGVRAELADVLALCEERTTGRAPVDVFLVFVNSRAVLLREFPRAARVLAPAGMLWVCWPKKSSGVRSDLTDDVVREVGLAAGLVDVKVAAVSETWSGLKFVRRRADRGSPS
jgi:hypothetical protein